MESNWQERRKIMDNTVTINGKVFQKARPMEREITVMRKEQVAISYEIEVIQRLRELSKYKRVMIELGALETPKRFDNTRYGLYYDYNSYGDFPWTKPMFGHAPVEGLIHSWVDQTRSGKVDESQVINGRYWMPAFTQRAT
jgi:hypothetical protein